ncbi:MAG: hypothetical protein LBL76_06220, partial [Treponema sp.]|nr:hypothetical protein [Treponema sp.]
GVLIYQKNNGPAIEIDIPKTLNGNNTPFIVVDGDSVHLVVVSNQSDINYWKIANGAPSDRKVIATGTSLFLYGDVVLSGNNLYMGGFVGGKAVYWKYPKDAASAEAVSLSDETSAIIGGIAKSGDFIYLAGREQVDGGPRPFYWKLNTETNHVDKISVDTTGTITHIVVSGDTVYLSGSQGSPSVGGYWKVSNDTDSTWCPIDGATSMTRLALDGTDLYAVRSHATSAAYWKINAETGEILQQVPVASSDTGFSSISGITVR